MREQEVVVFIMSLMIFAGVVVLWMAMNSRRRFREMEHRERMAMIQAGLMPAPELDPAAFERKAAMQQPQLFTRVPEPEAGTRSRNAGVMFMGLGTGLLILITFAGESPEIGLGVGGAFAALGGACLVNARLANRREDFYRPYYPNRMTPRAQEPPDPRNGAA